MSTREMGSDRNVESSTEEEVVLDDYDDEDDEQVEQLDAINSKSTQNPE